MHMAANLVDNVRDTLEGYAVGCVYRWSESTVALYWVAGKSNYKQFVANRVKKINAKDYIEWRHVSSDQNPADIGSRGSQNEELLELWLMGPNWFPNPELWPAPVETEPSKESEAEAKLVKEVFAVAIEPDDRLHQLLHNH